VFDQSFREPATIFARGSNRDTPGTSPNLNGKSCWSPRPLRVKHRGYSYAILIRILDEIPLPAQKKF
jgi:hypothetical protein